MNLMEKETSVQEEDNSVKSYSCEKCETAVFKSMQELSLHRKSQHESTRFECENCDYKTSHLGHFKEHKASVHVGVRYFCDICGKYFVLLKFGNKTESFVVW